MSAIEFTEEDLAAADARAKALSVRTSKETGPEVLRRVAHEMGVHVADLVGRRRTAHLSRARKLLYRELRKLGWSYPEIARFVGNRDHTTVMYGCKGDPRKAVAT